LWPNQKWVRCIKNQLVWRSYICCEGVCKRRTYFKWYISTLRRIQNSWQGVIRVFENAYTLIWNRWLKVRETSESRIFFECDRIIIYYFLTNFSDHSHNVGVGAVQPVYLNHRRTRLAHCDKRIGESDVLTITSSNTLVGDIWCRLISNWGLVQSNLSWNSSNKAIEWTYVLDQRLVIEWRIW
jgi:hypothetical protein